MFRGLAVLQDMLGVGVEFVAFVAVGRFAGDGVVVRLEGGDDAAVLAEGCVLEDAVVVAGVVDAERRRGWPCPGRRSGAACVSKSWMMLAMMRCLALFGAHQLLHRGPAFAEDGLLKIVQRFGFPLEVGFNGLRRGETLRHVAGLVFQIEHHLVGDAPRGICRCGCKCRKYRAF